MKRRTKKLIKSGLQLKLVVAFSALAGVAAMFQVLLLNYSLMRLARESLDNEFLLARMYGLLATNLVVTLGVLFPLMLVFGIMITHRIAGPIYRFEQHLAAVSRGEDAAECSLRDGDELQELCDAINDAVRSLREGRDRQIGEPVDLERVDADPSSRAA